MVGDRAIVAVVRLYFVRNMQHNVNLDVRLEVKYSSISVSLCPESTLVLKNRYNLDIFFGASGGSKIYSFSKKKWMGLIFHRSVAGYCFISDKRDDKYEHRLLQRRCFVVPLVEFARNRFTAKFGRTGGLLPRWLLPSRTPDLL